MQEPGADTSATLGRRGDAHWARARGSLALGRHAEALDAVRRARRYRSAVEGPLLALAEGDALLGLQRYREVVGVATRALGRGALEPDLSARLRVLRGHGLWLTGRVASGGGEVRRAAAEARAPLTRGRVHEALALFAWKGQELEKAADHLRHAHAVYADGGPPAALARVLAKEAGVLRDFGRMDEALVVQDRRLQAASAAGRADLVAEARADRASLFTALGRWAEADQELDVAGELFGRIGDGRDTATAGLVRVVVDLARGDLPRARATLDRAREWMAERGNVRGLAETLLLTSDLHLAARQPGDADRTALESLDLLPRGPGRRRPVPQPDPPRARVDRARPGGGRGHRGAACPRQGVAHPAPTWPPSRISRSAARSCAPTVRRRGPCSSGRRGWWPTRPAFAERGRPRPRSRAGARPRRRRGARGPRRDRSVGRSLCVGVLPRRSRRARAAHDARARSSASPSAAPAATGPRPHRGGGGASRRGTVGGTLGRRDARAAAGAPVVARGAGRGRGLGAARRPRPAGAPAAARSRARPGRRRRLGADAARCRGMGRAPDPRPPRHLRRDRRAGLAGSGAVRGRARRSRPSRGGARADPRRRPPARVPPAGPGAGRGGAARLSGDRRRRARPCATFSRRWRAWRLPTSPSTSPARRGRARRRWPRRCTPDPAARAGRSSP